MSWTLLMASKITQFAVAAAASKAGLTVFLPYTLDKVRVPVRGAKRATFTCEVVKQPRWPGYLFVQTPCDEDILAAMSYGTPVRGAEGLPASLPDHIVDVWRKDCAADGLVLKRSTMLGWSIGDVLRFVAASPMAGVAAQIVDLSDLDDSGVVGVLVNDRLPARVSYNSLA
jgi:hypothetical protein